MGHGNWLPWIDREFGWKEQTARNFTRVAEAFKSPSLGDFTSLNIEATALYYLSAPKVPEEVRAGDAAERGGMFTIAEAESLVAERVVETRKRFRRGSAAPASTRGR